MLKRQRQPSSPPTSSNIHLVPDLGAGERHAKRRRTQQQPMLDEVASRGVDDNDDEEDGCEDDPATTAAAQATNASDEYKSANTMLRDLHILNQHRLIFSPPAPHSSSATQTSSLNPTHRPPYPVYSTTPAPKLHPVQMGKLPRHKTAEQLTGHFEEAGVISDNYENINKVLGSLFLSRRRVLDSSSQSVSYP